MIWKAKYVLYLRYLDVRRIWDEREVALVTMEDGQKYDAIFRFKVMKVLLLLDVAISC